MSWSLLTLAKTTQPDTWTLSGGSPPQFKRRSVGTLGGLSSQGHCHGNGLSASVTVTMHGLTRRKERRRSLARKFKTSRGLLIGYLGARFQPIDGGTLPVGLRLPDGQPRGLCTFGRHEEKTIADPPARKARAALATGRKGVYRLLALAGSNPALLSRMCGTDETGTLYRCRRLILPAGLSPRCSVLREANY
jgi:hypothetical protein